jgi:molecular chaperone GrpE
MSEEKAAPRAANEDEEQEAEASDAVDLSSEGAITEEGGAADSSSSESSSSESPIEEGAESDTPDTDEVADEAPEKSPPKPPGPKMVVIDDDDPDLDNLEILTGPARSDAPGDPNEDEGDDDILIESEPAVDLAAERRKAEAAKKAQDAITESLIRAKNELQDVLKQTQKEAQTLQEQFLRSKADFENFKKRANREKEMAVKFANEKLLKELLPVLDNMERAVEAAESTAKEIDAKGTETVATGMAMVLKQFHDALGKFDVEQFSALNKIFDPNFHEAVQQVEDSSVPSGTVVQEYQKGYTLGGRLVRASMVIVSTGGPPPAKAKEGEAESPDPSDEDAASNAPDGASESGGESGDGDHAEEKAEQEKEAEKATDDSVDSEDTKNTEATEDTEDTEDTESSDKSPADQDEADSPGESGEDDNSDKGSDG